MPNPRIIVSLSQLAISRGSGAQPNFAYFKMGKTHFFNVAKVIFFFFEWLIRLDKRDYSQEFLAQLAPNTMTRKSPFSFHEVFFFFFCKFPFSNFNWKLFLLVLIRTSRSWRRLHWRRKPRRHVLLHQCGAAMAVVQQRQLESRRNGRT